VLFIRLAIILIMHGVVLYLSRNAIIYKGILVSAIVIASGVNTLPNALNFEIKTSLLPPLILIIILIII
jgi:hypothetical protein